MKHLISLFAILSLSLYISSAVHAQQLNLPKGKKFHYLISRADKLSKDDDQFIYAFESLGKNTDGNIALKCILQKAVITNNGVKYLNTDSIRNTTFNSTAIFLPLAMLNKPFTVIVNPKGKVIKTEGLQETLKAALERWKLTPEISNSILVNAGSAFNQVLQPMFFEFPDQNFIKSPQWENKDSGLKFKFNASKGSRVITSTQTDAAGMKQKHRYDLNPNSGLIQNAAEIYNFSSKSVNNDGDTTVRIGDVRLSQKLIAPAAIVKNDDLWVEMASRMSYWSNDLKTGAEYDSLKVKNVLNIYNEAFKDDPHFLVSKLSLTQQTRSNSNYQVYSDMLLTIPNKYLRGQDSHLHNKLGEALRKEGPQSAYEVSKYVYDKESFTSWLQQSFAQSFIMEHQFEGREQQEKNSNELLERFAADKNPIYINKTRALYLWVKAKQDKNNVKLQLQTAKSLNRMNDAQMLEGNGGRYSLLMYNQLLDAGKPLEADTLLNTAIVKLKRYAADSLSKTRYENQNLLAHAYYLKFLSVVRKDSTQALNYLSQAAQYSPKTGGEKAYGSFYDRVFLKSKESYRDEYIDHLLSNGNEAEALKLFALQVAVNPENMGEMQALYQRKFPNSDFKSFFISNIVGSWKSAPDFKLKNIDGKEHSLADYKNKWLVLDFWGTWCGPCKAELPEVNKFFVELAEGKHGDIKFLSVACYDTEPKVKSFIELNKYSIPVAMSDSKVERNYKISGYPSKILISPEGKMLQIQFGKDWKAILKQFNALYAAN